MGNDWVKQMSKDDLTVALIDQKNRSNEELGAALLLSWIRDQARTRGVAESDISEALADQIVREIPNVETNTAATTALEKALHKAADGDFAAAGKLVREYTMLGAKSMVDEKYAGAGIRRTVQASRFGERGANESRRKGQENRNKVLQAARTLIERWKSSRMPTVRELAPKLAEITGLSETAVRRHLKGDNLKNIWAEKRRP